MAVVLAAGARLEPGQVESEQHEGSVRMAYVRGPEGIIVSLFEQIG